MVGVRHDLVRAACQAPHAVVQVVEADGIVTRVPPGRLEPQSGRDDVADGQQSQPLEADQRHLLGQLFQRGVADGEHRDPVYAIDAAVAQQMLR